MHEKLTAHEVSLPLSTSDTGALLFLFATNQAQVLSNNAKLADFRSFLKQLGIIKATKSDKQQHSSLVKVMKSRVWTLPTADQVNHELDHEEVVPDELEPMLDFKVTHKQKSEAETGSVESWFAAKRSKMLKSFANSFLSRGFLGGNLPTWFVERRKVELVLGILPLIKNIGVEPGSSSSSKAQGNSHSKSLPNNPLPILN